MSRLVVSKSVGRLPSPDPLSTLLAGQTKAPAGLVDITLTGVVNHASPGVVNMSQDPFVAPVPDTTPPSAPNRPVSAHLVAVPLGSPDPTPGPGQDLGTAWITSVYPRSSAPVPADGSAFTIPNPATVPSEGRLVLEYPV